MLINEIKKSIFNKGMLLSLFIGHLISIIYWGENYYKQYTRQIGIQELDYYVNQSEETPFVMWIVGHPNKYYVVLLYLLPILAVLPYAASYWREKRTGYEKNVIIRCSRAKYRISKYIAVFLSGGLAVSLVWITDLMMCFTYFEYRMPVSSAYATMTGSNTMLGVFFYKHPFIYCGIFIVAAFVFAGAIATVSLWISTISNNYFTVMLIPFLVITMLGAFVPPEGSKYLPISFLIPFNSGNKFFMVILSCLVMFVISVIGFVVAGKKKDCL